MLTVSVTVIVILTVTVILRLRIMERALLRESGRESSMVPKNQTGAADSKLFWLSAASS